MKALTLTQPWASLIAAGAKRIETRSWQTKYRGQILIHASKVPDAEFTEHPTVQKYLKGQQPPLGAFVAVCELVACTTTESARKQLHENPQCPDEALFGNYQPKRYAWILDNVQALSEPLECKGNRMLWNPPDSIVQLAIAQLQQPTSAQLSQRCESDTSGHHRPGQPEERT